MDRQQDPGHRRDILRPEPRAFRSETGTHQQHHQQEPRKAPLRLLQRSAQGLDRCRPGFGRPPVFQPQRRRSHPHPGSAHHRYPRRRQGAGGQHAHPAVCQKLLPDSGAHLAAQADGRLYVDPARAASVQAGDFRALRQRGVSGAARVVQHRRIRRGSRGLL